MKYLLTLLTAALLLSCDASETTVADGIKSPPDVSHLPPLTMANHDSLMLAYFGEPRKDIERIGILVYDGVNTLDALGPRYVLRMIPGAQVDLVALEPGNVTTVTGLELVPTTVVDSVDQLDILVIPGGFRGTLEATRDSNLHDWIRRIDAGSQYTASVCTGGHILAATGLLKGRKATTNWYRAAEFMAHYGAEFVDARWTSDGKYWTSAGVTAGMDMSLALLAEVKGEAYAQAIMLDMEYDPEPPFVGGSPETSSPEVWHMMMGMYDYGFGEPGRDLE